MRHPLVVLATLVCLFAVGTRESQAQGGTLPNAAVAPMAKITCAPGKPIPKLYEMTRLQVIRYTPRIMNDYIRHGVAVHTPYHQNKIINEVGRRLVGGTWGAAIGVQSIGLQLVNGPLKPSQPQRP